MQPAKNPGVAAVLSFLITGLGQIYNGKLLKGFAFMAIGALNVLLMFLVIGFITGPLFWIFNIYDAYRGAERINRAAARSGAPQSLPGWGNNRQTQ